MSRMLTGRTALVTGASGGIGADIARELARLGADLVLVARREAALDALAAELRAGHGVGVAIHAVDLAVAAQRIELASVLGAVEIDILVNNAGFGVFGRFADASWARLDEMLQLDIVALSHLTHLFLPGMLARRWGRILLLGSTGSFQPTPYYAAYSAAKAHVLSFGVALNQELQGTGVSCTTLCPGITATDFLKNSGQRATLYQRLTMMQSPVVAAQGVRALLGQRASLVPGVVNTITALSTRLMPRGLAAVVAGQLMRN